MSFYCAAEYPLFLKGNPSISKARGSPSLRRWRQKMHVAASDSAHLETAVGSAGRGRAEGYGDRRAGRA